jgi:hypothetical protein
MKKEIFTCMVIILTLLCPMFLTAQTAYLCGSQDSIRVLNDEYIIYNNIWGAGAGEQCIDVDGTRFIVAHSTHDSTGVAAYPCIYKGFHYWHSETSNSGMPVRISDLGAIPIEWDIAGTNAGGMWNAAYESWFSTTGNANPANGGELMIWVNYSQATPGGDQVGTVNLEGYTWEVWYADWDWNYVAYRITTKIDYINFDLKPFIDDCVSRGYLNSGWYLDNLEAGFEIWQDGQGLEQVSFSGYVTTGSTTPNPTQPPQTPAPTAPTTNNLGDVNNDGSITIVDALLIAQYYVDLNPSPFDSSRGDTDCDGDIDIIDALLVAQYYVNLIPGFC